MKKSWAVEMTFEHWFDQSTKGAKGEARVRLTVERVVEGDDEAGDALWAALEAKEQLRAMYHIPAKAMLHVTNIQITETL
jgi:hypothetical protein